MELVQGVTTEPTWVPIEYELRVLLGLDALGRIRQKSSAVRGTKRQVQCELNRLVLEHGGKLSKEDDSRKPRNERTTINETSSAGARTAGCT